MTHISLSPEFKNSNILVTGGGGFLGSHLVEALAECGCHNISAPRSAEVDLTDARATESLFQSTTPDLVFHLAARVGGIGANRAHPGVFFRDNMAMGLNVLEAARRAKSRKVVIIGTVCAYAKHTPVPFREADLWNGYPEETNAPYGIAKRALLVMAQAYRAEFGCNMITLFPANLYGPRDNFDLETSHVIPAMIRKFDDAVRLGQNKVTLWGDGSPTREFLYVNDAVDGLILAANKYDNGDPINLGANCEISIHDIAQLVARKTGFQGSIEWDTSKPNGQPRRAIDATLAKERFGFAARTQLSEGLDATISWFREHQSSLRGPK